jgi:hypothetical protein
MSTVDTFGSFRDAIAKSRPAVQQISSALRKLVSQVYPTVVEVPWPRLQVIGYGIGPKKSTEHFCYIGLYGTHVNLGFNYGVKLPDPNGLLKGTGKRFRHVKIMDLRDLKQPALKTLLRATVAERRNALGKNASV